MRRVKLIPSISFSFYLILSLIASLLITGCSSTGNKELFTKPENPFLLNATVRFLPSKYNQYSTNAYTNFANVQNRIVTVPVKIDVVKEVEEITLSVFENFFDNAYIWGKEENPETNVIVNIDVLKLSIKNTRENPGLIESTMAFNVQMIDSKGNTLFNQTMTSNINKKVADIVTANPLAGVADLGFSILTLGIKPDLTKEMFYNHGFKNALKLNYINAFKKGHQAILDSNGLRQTARLIEQKKTAPSDLVMNVKFSEDNSLIPNQCIDGAEEAEIVVELQNKGSGTAYDVMLNVKSDHNNLKFPVTRKVGDIPPGELKAARLPIAANKALKDGSATFFIKATEKRGYSSRPIQLEIPTMAMRRPEIAIADCNISDGGGLARGDGDKKIENNETVALEPLVQNTGVGEALQVDVRITDITPGIELVQAGTELSGITPNTISRAFLAFHIPRTFSRERIEYTIAATDVRGITTQKTFSIPFQTQAPKLYMSYQVLDDKGNEVPSLENGKDYRIKIASKNIGSNIATGVNLKVRAPAEGAYLGNFNNTIGRLKPDANALPVLVPISIDRAFRENLLTLDVVMSQDDFPGLSKKIKMPVRTQKPSLGCQVTLMNGVSENSLTQNSRPRFRVSVSNTGDLAAENVKIHFLVDHPGISYQKQRLIGTIQPGQSQYTDFQFFVRGDTSTGDLPLQVEITQADFRTLSPEIRFAIKEQKAIRQTVVASSSQNIGSTIYAGAPELYVNTPHDNIETLKETIPIHGSIISYGKGNALDRFSMELNGRALRVVSNRNSVSSEDYILTTREGNKMVFDGRIKLKPGQNILRIEGVDRNNKSCSQKLTVNKKARLGDIYALIIGISKFANADYNLNYAASDAEKFYQFLRSDAGGGLAHDRIHLLTDYEATRARVIEELTRFLGRATRDDTVEIYLATHGLVGDDGSLYYLCYNTDTDNLKGSGFSDEDLADIVSENISAGKVILYLDACHTGLSGLSSRMYARRGIEVNEVNKKINNLAVGLSRVSKTGVATFSATSASGYSLEGKDWEGGIFTHCLVNGLKGEANKNKDEWVTIKELDNYLTTQIMSLTNGRQKPRLRCTLPAESTPLSKIK